LLRPLGESIGSLAGLDLDERLDDLETLRSGEGLDRLALGLEAGQKYLLKIARR
jgi:hypothetical protein